MLGPIDELFICISICAFNVIHVCVASGIVSIVTRSSELKVDVVLSNSAGGTGRFAATVLLSTKSSYCCQGQYRCRYILPPEMLVKASSVAAF